MVQEFLHLACEETGEPHVWTELNGAAGNHSHIPELSWRELN